MKIFLLLILGISGVFQAAQQEPVEKTTFRAALGETRVKINIDAKTGSGPTFFAPHHNEQTAIRLAKEFIGQKGGRLVEIESFNANSNPARRDSGRCLKRFIACSTIPVSAKRNEVQNQ